MSLDHFQNLWKIGKLPRKVDVIGYLEENLRLNDERSKERKGKNEEKEEEVKKGLVLLAGILHCGSKEHKEELQKDLEWMETLWKETYGYKVATTYKKENGSITTEETSLQLTMHQLNNFLSQQSEQLKHIPSDTYDGLFFIWSTCDCSCLCEKSSHAKVCADENRDEREDANLTTDSNDLLVTSDQKKIHWIDDILDTFALPTHYFADKPIVFIKIVHSKSSSCSYANSEVDTNVESQKRPVSKNVASWKRLVAKNVASWKRPVAKNQHRLCVVNALDSQNAFVQSFCELMYRNAANAQSCPIPSFCSVIKELSCALSQKRSGKHCVQMFPEIPENLILIPNRNLENIAIEVSDCEKAIQIYENVLREYNKKNPVEEAKLYNNLGVAYEVSGQLEKAIECHNKTLELRIKALGSTHLEVASAYNNLGVDYERKGELEKAIDCHEHVLKIRVDALGPNHLDVAKVYVSLSANYDSKGKLDKAIECEEKALQIRMKALGSNHLDVAQIYCNLGVVHSKKRNTKKAVYYHEKALKIRHRLLGLYHADVAQTYLHLGSLYAKQEGQVHKSIDCLKRVLKIRLNLFGEQHLEVANIYSILGNAYCEKGKWKKGLCCREKALMIQTKNSGSAPLQLANACNDLAIACQQNGQVDKAIQFFEQSLNLIKVQGALHLDVATLYSNLGNAHSTKKMFEKAVEFHEKALHIKLNLLGTTHLDVASAYFNLGATYDKIKNVEKAIYCHQETLRIWKATLSESHPYIQTAIAKLKVLEKVRDAI